MRIIILFFFILFSSITFAEILNGKVVGVSDGDTITILDENNIQHKVRLAGIDAPEKKQDFGSVSKRSLSDMVFNQQVNVEWGKTDRYGRIVGKVLHNGKDVNLEQIILGMAWYYRKYQNELVFDDRINYLHAEEVALKNQIGIWSLQSPIPPWDFRKIAKAK